MAKQAVFEPITPARPRALTPSKRKRIEHRIEELIAVLDAEDAPLEDLEDGADEEPDDDGEGSLGWADDKNQERALKNCVGESVMVCGPDREGGDSDLEPSLASRGCTYDADYFNQENWAAGSNDDDREKDAGDEGESGQDEDHDLGWPEMVNQARATVPPAWGSLSCGDESESSLGSLDGEMNQAKWSRGSRSDLEEQCEDEGHDSDSEPDIEADREPNSAPFELVQDGAP